MTNYQRGDEVDSSSDEAVGWRSLAWDVVAPALFAGVCIMGFFTILNGGRFPWL